MGLLTTRNVAAYPGMRAPCIELGVPNFGNIFCHFFFWEGGRKKSLKLVFDIPAGIYCFLVFLEEIIGYRYLVDSFA